MSDDWRERFRSWMHPDTFAHPNSPAGGSGTGSSRVPGFTSYSWSRVPPPDSPAGRHFSWHDISRIDIEDRAMAVYEAYRIALHEAPQAISQATGYELYEMLRGIVPGLLVSLTVVAVPTVGLGAAFGLLALPAGPEVAVPLAGVGARAGLAAGVWILEELGLAFLVGYIYSSLLQGEAEAKQASKQAWNSVDHPQLQRVLVQRAGWQLAFALGTVCRGVLQGIAAFLLAKGPAAAASRVPELVGKLRASRLGASFAEFVEQNWKGLIDNPRLKGEVASGSRGGGSTGGESSAAPILLRSGAGHPEPPPEIIQAPEHWPVSEAANPRNRLEAGSARGYPKYPLLKPEQPLLPKNWSRNDVLSQKQLNTFHQVGPRVLAEPIELPPGTKLYRVEDKAGTYFQLEKPTTEQDLRGGMAVKTGWNTGTRYSEYEVQKPGARVWVGPTGPQDASVPGYNLPGGSNQVVAPPAAMQQLKKVGSSKTPWTGNH